MSTNNVAVRNGRNHGNGGRVVPKPFGKVSPDPVLDDLLAEATAISLQLATSGVKQLAAAGGVSTQTASRWRIDGRGNSLFDLTRIVYGLMKIAQHPGAIVAHIHTAICQALMPVSDADLVERFWSLMRGESEAVGRKNFLQASARVSDLENLERALIEVAGIQQELAAVCRELRRRRIDPRAVKA